MLCCSGEGERKPPWIVESRLVVQRASSATQSARSAGAPPPSACLLLHHLLHPFPPRLPGLSYTENVQKKMTRPVHTSLPPWADRQTHARCFHLNLLWSGNLIVWSSCCRCIELCLPDLHVQLTIIQETGNSHSWESDPGMKEGREQKEKETRCWRLGKRRYVTFTSRSLSTKPSLEESPTASRND